MNFQTYIIFSWLRNQLRSKVPQNTQMTGHKCRVGEKLGRLKEHSHHQIQWQQGKFLTATPGQNHSALTLDTPSGYVLLSTAMMSSLYSLPQKFVVLRLCWLSNLSGTNHLISIGTMFARHLSHTENGYIIQKNTMKNNVLACKLPTLFKYATSAVIWNDDCDMLCNLSIHYLQKKKKHETVYCDMFWFKS